MQTFTLETIREAAEAAGMPEGRVMNLSRADNITIPRPRMELQWLPETFTRTGRLIGFSKIPGNNTAKTLKKELYEVSLDVSCNILTEDGAWLSNFIRLFLAELPRGKNDTLGNYVKITAQRGEWTNIPDNRVGLDTITVFPKAAELLVIRFIWRVTEEQQRQLITDITLTPKGVKYGEKG